MSTLLSKIKQSIPLGTDPQPNVDVTGDELKHQTSDGDPDADSNTNDNSSSDESQSEQNQPQGNTDSENDASKSGNSTEQDPSTSDDEQQSSLTDFGDENNTSEEQESDTDGGNESNENEPQKDGSEQGGSDSTTDSEQENSTDDNSGEGNKDTESDNESTEDDSSGEGEPSNDDVETPPEFDDDFNPDQDFIDQEQDKVDSEQNNREQKEKNAQDELEKFLDSFSSSDSAGGGELGEIEFNAYPDPRVDYERWQKAREGYETIAGLLEKRLKKARRDSWNRGKKSGTIDSNRLHALKTKQLNVMKRRNPGDDREFAVIIVLDRSGSMGGDRIDVAENAMVKYALAMEDIGIDVCIIDMYKNTPRVASPFDISIAESKGDLLTRETGGGTPLRKIIPLARKRMDNSNKIPIVLSITDGNPEKEEKYLNELEKCPMPVFGITVLPGRTRTNTQSHPHERYYDAHTVANSVNDLLGDLEEFTLQLPILQ